MTQTNLQIYPLKCAAHTEVTGCVNRTLTMRLKTCLIAALYFQFKGRGHDFRLDYFDR